MDRDAYERRMEAWRRFNEWEREQQVQARPLSELLAWVDELRRLFNVREEPIDDKVRRIGEIRRRLSALRRQA